MPVELKPLKIFGKDESMLSEYSIYLHNSNKTTAAVGQKKPNLWDLYDLYGNYVGISMILNTMKRVILLTQFVKIHLLQNRSFGVYPFWILH